MPADVGDNVHPWYRGVHEWRVKEVAKLASPIEYRDAEQGIPVKEAVVPLTVSKISEIGPWIS